MNALISVIIPCFNVEKYLEKCVESILNQSYSNLEVLLCDDGSTDETWEVIKQLQNKDVRVRSFQNAKNSGVVPTRNLLIKQSQGEYIALQDSDDWSDPDRLEKQAGKLQQNAHLIACGTGYSKTDNTGKVLFEHIYPKEHEEIKKVLPDQYHFLPGSVMFRSSFFKEQETPYHMYFNNCGNEDLYLVGKLILDHKFENISEPLYYYRLNLDSLTKLGESENLKKHYVHEITYRLLDDYRSDSTNWLEKNDHLSLETFESQVASRYNQTPHLTFEKNMGQLLFWKQYGKAYGYIWSYVQKNGLSLYLMKMLLYVTKKQMLHS